MNDQPTSFIGGEYVWSRLRLVQITSAPLQPAPPSFCSLQPSTLSCFTIYGHFHALPFLPTNPWPPHYLPRLFLSSYYKNPHHFPLHQLSYYSVLTSVSVLVVLLCFLLPVTYLPFEHCIDCSLVLVFSCLIN